jgi:hypothetical protein
VSNVINAKLAKSVAAAVSGDIKLGNTWQQVGTDAREAYPSEAALIEAKAFILDMYIVPAMPGATKILAVVQHRKGSPAYLEACAKDATYKEQHRAADDAKKSVRAMAHTYFARIVKYAFPTEKGASTPRTLKTRIMEEVTALVKGCQKAEDADFDLTATLAALEAVLVAVNKK